MKKTTLLFVAFLLSAVSAFAQMTIKGKVLDDLGEPAIGATVMEVGTQNGTATDFDGNFTLKVSGNHKIKVSYVGFKDQELAPKATMNIRLQSDAQALDGIEVVSTGMMTQDKRLFTGSTTRVNADDAKLDGMADVSRSLEGRSSGVSVQNVSGTFGTAPKIRVRGATSIYGLDRPLWVVDGVILEDAVELAPEDLSSGDATTLIASAISGINADDIESFEILKDGSATSIYGARAMAGVIVVTTKKGKSGQGRLNYTGEFTYRMIPSYRDYNIVNSQEQMDIYNELEQKGWLEYASLKSAKNYGIYGRMYELINTYDATSGRFGIANTLQGRNAYLREAEFRNTDWFKELFNNNLMQNHALSFSAGTDRAKIYASLSVMNDPGWYKSSNVERYTANMNASYDITKKLTISIATNGSYRMQRAPGTSDANQNVLTGEASREFDINPFSFSLNNSRAQDPNDVYRRNYCSFNVKDELDLNYIQLKVTDVKFQGELNYKPIAGLELRGLAAIRYFSSGQEQIINDNSNQARAYRAGIDPEDATIRDANSGYLYTDPDDETALPETMMPVGGIYLIDNRKLLSTDFRATAQYKRGFGQEQQHIMNVFGGMESNSTDRQYTLFEGWGYQYENGGVPYTDYTLFKQYQETGAVYYLNSYSYYRNLAFFATGTYSYKGKYIANGTIRYEGSNKLGKSRKARWLPTWNVSGAWNAHEENWFRNTFRHAWTNATLKASYSLTATRGPASVTNSLPVFTSYQPYRPFASVSETGINLSQIENSELTYEKKYELNIGTALGFLDNRINFEFDYYRRDNFDLIGMTYTTGVGGAISKTANVAAMKSNGLEFTLSTLNIKQKNFKWSTDLIFSYATNEVTDLQSFARVYSLVYGAGTGRVEGYPLGALFSYQFAGLSEDGLPQFYTNAERTEKTITDINFQDLDYSYLKYEGPTDPPITGSLGNNFSYKGFKLNLFITYSFGNYIRLNKLTYVLAEDYSDIWSSPKEMKNRWQKPGDEKYTNIPVIATKRQYHDISHLNYAYSAYNFSDQRVAKGDFIRLKEVSLAYDFPAERLVSRKHKEEGKEGVVRSLGLKFSATNLWLIYSDKAMNGQDPEYYNTGGVASPIPRQFTFTVRLGL
ncbi:MAG: SusC/RagA family TonB-linked outer membrane protein [Paludibacteraceae bacterium]|nr:SusC/RagA family TonB-linked outer membrane protein [Paludibacteraceae bacterium]